MSYATTPKLGLFKPTVDADDNLWGGHLNQNADVLDTIVGSVANVLNYGADPTGTTDSTTAVRNAIATGRTVYVPKGVYKLTDMLTLNNGQLMYGDGRITSQFNVYHDSFFLGALGVVRLAPGETGGSMRDIGIYCIQPQTTVRANLVPFPPAIYAQAAGRFQLIRVRLSAVMVGLDARGNCGGAFIHDFEVGAFDTGMIWGGSFDGVHVDNYRFWSFGINSATDLYAVYSDGATNAMVSGRVDGFTSSSFFSWLGHVRIDCSATPNYGVFEFNNLTIDGPRGTFFLTAAYRVQIDNFIGGKYDSVAIPLLVQTGGTLRILNTWIETNATVTTWQISAGSASVASGRFISTRTDTTAIAISGTAAVRFGQVFFAAAPGAMTQPFITQSGTSSSLRLDNCEFEAQMTGFAVAIGADNFRNQLGLGVRWNNARLSLPAALLPGPGTTAVLGFYGPIIRPVVDYSSMQSGAFSFTTLATNNNRLTAYGAEALGKITAGTALHDTAFGARAGRDLTTGQRNSFFGTDAGILATIGSDNTALGEGAMKAATSALRNTAVGSSAAKLLTGSGNTIVGYLAGSVLTTGAQNTIVGDRVAATNLQTGVGNILIGVDPTVDTPAAGTGNFFGLGGSGGVTFSATAMNTAAPAWIIKGTVGVSGGLGVFGATPPASKPAVTGSRAGNAALATLLAALAAAGFITDSSTA